MMIAIPSKIPAFRDYQKETYTTLWNHEGEPSILQLPTGAGKGLIICKLIIDCLVKGKSVLVLVPTIELLDNIYDRLVSYSSFIRPMVGRLATGRGTNPDYPVLIGVYKSVFSQLKKNALPHFHVVISDECHHAAAHQWSTVIDHFDHSWQIGFTATPARLDGKPLGLLYKNLIQSKPVDWFIKNGYLANYYLRSHKTSLNFSSSFNDSLGDQQDYFDKKGIIGDAIKEWETYALGQKTLFFCTGITHANHVVHEFNSHFNGRYKFGYIGSDLTAKQREKVLTDYKKGLYTGLANVAIVTEGVDIPDVSCVSALRYTASLPLWLQMVGRALRPKKGNGKATILDHAGNALVHGAPDFDHDWELDPDQDSLTGNSKISCPCCDMPVTSYKKLASYGDDGVDISCPNCGFVNHYQHTITERGERDPLPVIDTSKELTDYSIDPIEFKINKIVSSNKLQQKKVQAIKNLDCALTLKVRALRKLGLTQSMIEIYLDIGYNELKTNNSVFTPTYDLLGI